MGRETIRYRRRKFFIKRGLQGRFVIGFSSAVLIGLLLNMLLVYFLIDRELASELYTIHLKIRTTSQIAVPVLWKLAAVTVPFILAVSAVVGYFLTRRVEGSLEEVGQTLKKTGHGDFTQRLGGSAGTELSGTFNSAVKSLARKFGALKTSGALLDEGLDRLNGALGRPSPSKKEIESALDRISEARERIGRELSGFKV
ncbi:MAG: hypothetical protein ACE5GY_01970 [Thermodesulfobacteriota bacterium]